MMLTQAQRDELKPIVRTMQIIVGALAVGLLNFMAVVVAIRMGSERMPSNPSRFTYVAVGLAALAVVASFVVPMYLAGSMRQPTAKPGATTGDAPDIRSLATRFQTLLIIRCAILEGAAFFCLSAYMIDRQIAAVVMANVLLMILLVQFPTSSRLEAWIENELVLAEQMRQLP